MKRSTLRQIIADIDARIFDLDLALTESEEPQVIVLALQRLLEHAQQRLDDARKDG